MVKGTCIGWLGTKCAEQERGRYGFQRFWGIQSSPRYQKNKDGEFLWCLSRYELECLRPDISVKEISGCRDARMAFFPLGGASSSQKDLVRMGLIWRTRNGFCINIAHNDWITTVEYLKAQVVRHIQQISHVNDLLNSHGTSWGTSVNWWLFFLPKIFMPFSRLPLVDQRLYSVEFHQEQTVYCLLCVSSLHDTNLVEGVSGRALFVRAQPHRMACSLGMPRCLLK